MGKRLKAEQAHQDDILIGVIIAKLEKHRLHMRGYIAMLAVQAEHRGRGIGKSNQYSWVNCVATHLVESALAAMEKLGADEVQSVMRFSNSEVCLETETTNQAAMSLYENMGFVRYKRLHRYYLNAGDAFRFILPIKHSIPDAGPVG